MLKGRFFPLILIGMGVTALAAFGLTPDGTSAWPLALAGLAVLAPEAERTELEPVEERQEGTWHVYPLEGALQLAYRDVAGNPSLRRILARELKVGPGKVLLGGIDVLDDGYRGFRADRIDLLVDAATGETVDRNILDWLVNRALRQAKARRKAQREADRAK